MRKLLLAAASAAALTFGAPAQAIVLTPGDVLVGPGDGLAVGESATFLVSGDPFSGPLTATFSHNGIPIGNFQDLLQFTIGQDGLGSGSVTTSVTIPGFGTSIDTDLLSVFVNGLAADLVLRDGDGNICPVRGVGTCGATETWSINDVPIAFGVLNTIEINGLSRGSGSYGGNATFAPVPEPGTWAMMLIGFGAVGFSIRRRRSAQLPQIA